MSDDQEFEFVEQDVICPNCGENWLTTTDRFDPDKEIHAAMFRLKQQYRDQGWSFCDSEFPNDSIGGEQVVCPHCGSRLSDSNYRFNGRLSSLQTHKQDREPKKKYVCPVCGRGWDHPGPYNGHMRGPCGKK